MMKNNCCKNLFKGFEKFEDLRTVIPPKEKGVYVIRVKTVWKNTDEIEKKMKPIIKKLNWKLIGDELMKGIDRLKKINDCRIIYIGSSKDLKRRYTNFTGSHPIKFPIWVLLYYGWSLEYSFLRNQNHESKEKDLLREYKKKKKHHGCIPALNLKDYD